MSAKSLRQSAQELADAMARAGLDADIWHRTPAEIHRAVDALLQRRAELDALAWSIGQYVAIGLRAPQRYPPPPTRREARAMGEEEMRRALTDMAERRRQFDH